MKVLMINNTFGNFGGGSEKVNYETGKILSDKGFEVFFFSSNKKPYYEENYQFGNFFPAEFDKCKLCSPIRILYNTEAEKKLSRLLKIIKPDIAHVNSISHNLTVSVLIACKKNNIPVVMTLHDSHPTCPAATLIKGKKGYCKNISCSGGNILPCITNKCYSNSFIKSSIAALEFLFKKIGKYYDIPDAFICPSNFLLEIAHKSGFQKSSLFVVNNFINPQLLEKQPNYSHNNYFLYVGRLVKEKGLEYLLEAFKDLPEIRLKIVGDGVYRQNLEKYANDLKLSNIEFLGHKTLWELESLYKNSIATILPSICSEIFGLTILESFAFGKPVIASRIGGIPEVITDNYNGLLVAPRNAEEIRHAVLKLNNNNDFTVHLGKNARRSVEEQFNTEIYFEKLQNIYLSVLEKNSLKNFESSVKEEIGCNLESFIH